MARPSTTCRGFTLLELIVVLILISLSSALVVPRLAGSLAGLQVKTTAKKIGAALRHARSRAATESAPYTAIFDLDGNRFSLHRNLPSEDGGLAELAATAGENGLLAPYTLPAEVRISEAISAGGESQDSGLFAIYFLPSGASSGGEILLADNQNRRQSLRIDFITGTVRIDH